MTVTMLAKKTWDEVLAHNQWQPDPLQVLRLINIGTLQSWTFTVTTGRGNNTRLRIVPEHSLPMSVVSSIFDGSIPELFNCDVVDFRMTGNRDILVDLPVGLESPATETTDAVVHFELSGYFGNRIPRELQDHDRVTNFCYDRTRLGSEKYRSSTKAVTWRVLGSEQVVRAKPRIRLEEFAAPRYFANLSIGGYSAWVASAFDLKKGELRHSDNGIIPSSEWGSILADTFRRSPFSIELDVPSVGPDVLGHYAPRATFLDVLSSLRTGLDQIVGARDYRDFQKICRRARLTEQSQKLQQRQEAAQRSPFVYFEGSRLIRVPTGETEAVALAMKLEALDAIPFDTFQVVEYTPRAGIDALAHLRFKPEDALQPFAPVEFEFVFENFMAHAHPIEQVRLVVCWDLGHSERTAEDLGLVADNEHGCVFWFRRGNHSVPVLVMSRMPGISFNGGETDE